MASDSGSSGLGFSYKNLFGKHLYSYLEEERNKLCWVQPLHWTWLDCPGHLHLCSLSLEYCVSQGDASLGLKVIFDQDKPHPLGAPGQYQDPSLLQRVLHCTPVHAVMVGCLAKCMVWKGREAHPGSDKDATPWGLLESSFSLWASAFPIQ